MIISKTPFRISFFGGGTDFPDFYNEFGGRVISTTIDKYCYVNVRPLPKFFDYKNEIIYSKVEQVKEIDEINHPMVRNCLKYLNINDIKVYYDADLPARTGLGTSSSFAVGLLNCLYRLTNNDIFKDINSEDGYKKYKTLLADSAIYVERQMCNESGGIQDQIASSFGGLNLITMGKEYNNGYLVKKIPLTLEDKNNFSENLMLFFTGISRNSFEIQSGTQKNLKTNIDKLKEMNELVDTAYGYLTLKQFDEIGKLLDYTWKIKRGLNNSISNNTIDEIYTVAKSVGALGGKLLGAGGGGFMLFYIKKENQDKLRGALKNLLEIPFKFDDDGSKIIYRTI